MPDRAVTDSRWAVIDVLKRHPEATVEQVAEELGVTVSGARQQLATLVDLGLIARREAAPQGRGRPRHHYVVTAQGDRLFPRAYGDLANELLGYLGREDPARVDSLFADRRDHRIEAALIRLEGLPFPERVAELARILDEDGYLADFRQEGEGLFRITEHNCAILDVALHHPGACSSEIEFLRAALPGATVERVTHIVEGAHACSYEIRAR